MQGENPLCRVKNLATETKSPLSDPCCSLFVHHSGQWSNTTDGCDDRKKGLLVGVLLPSDNLLTFFLLSRLCPLDG